MRLFHSVTIFVATCICCVWNFTWHRNDEEVFFFCFFFFFGGGRRCVCVCVWGGGGGGALISGVFSLVFGVVYWSRPPRVLRRFTALLFKTSETGEQLSYIGFTAVFCQSQARTRTVHEILEQSYTVQWRGYKNWSTHNIAILHSVRLSSDNSFLCLYIPLSCTFITMLMRYYIDIFIYWITTICILLWFVHMLGYGLIFRIFTYLQTFNISRTLVGNQLADH